MKIHLGCGKRHIPGWVHVDIADFPHIDHQHDCRTLLMFEDESADLIYACHLLEYFDWMEVVDVLREWRRVLRPGGTLRLSMPDFAALVELYKTTGNLADVLGSLYGRWDTGDGIVYHHMTFDIGSLSMILRLAGYRCIRRWDCNTVEHASVDDSSKAYWPHKDSTHGILLSLNMEADR